MVSNNMYIYATTNSNVVYCSIRKFDVNNVFSSH